MYIGASHSHHAAAAILLEAFVILVLSITPTEKIIRCPVAGAIIEV